ncbi:MAG TPA: NifU family protein [Candidatus Brocadiia bacterium]|nr:NifU family protein [Candidatus Brocadiia bacterium]
MTDQELKDRVVEALAPIKEQLKTHGGDCELVDVVKGIVKVKLTGACGHCPGARMTLKMGVEARLKKVIPEVEAVEAVS